MAANVAYLNCAYMSPMLNAVANATASAVDARREPWRILPKEWFGPAEELRGLFAQIIQAHADNIALIPSVSYGIAVAAGNIELKTGQHIILLEGEFPSNVYAWREAARTTGAKVVTVSRADNQTWAEVLLGAITTQTAVVSVPNCHWTDGSFVDLEAVGQRARSVNAKLVVDASQSLGAYPLDIEKVKPDFLVTVGYKWLFGPYGLAYLYAKDEYCQSGRPLEYSWINKMGSDNFTALVNYRDEYRPGARRFDAGEFPGIFLAPIALAGLKQILAWGVANIQETIAVLTLNIEEQARKKGYTPTPRALRVGHLLGVRGTPDAITALAHKLPANNVYVSMRGNNIRIAPHLYNSPADVLRLVHLL